MFGNLNYLSQKFDADCHKLKTMYDEEDENLFVPEDVNKIIKSTIEINLSDAEYKPDKISAWSANISEQILASLSKLNKMFKYVVTCSILQRSGAGLHTASSCYWDNSTDGICTVRWENNSLYCIVTVYGVGI
ncbi:unnamed protein product [Psylliodes chrysocephalus]|uniref:Dynein light chain n=1 Tax=Psylliodes chrysocephalus TaxID=3402493 RepID=A0A9P0G6X2_9CUCU|nr:unnamed protein product [Psylliodes chrysocephala]